jgi:hypothetical protein
VAHTCQSPVWGNPATDQRSGWAIEVKGWGTICQILLLLPFSRPPLPMAGRFMACSDCWLLLQGARSLTCPIWRLISEHRLLLSWQSSCTFLGGMPKLIVYLKAAGQGLGSSLSARMHFASPRLITKLRFFNHQPMTRHPGSQLRLPTSCCLTSNMK